MSDGRNRLVFDCSSTLRGLSVWLVTANPHTDGGPLLTHYCKISLIRYGQLYRYTNNTVITYVRARPCATNREESCPKKVIRGLKSLSRYNNILVSRIVIKGFYWYHHDGPLKDTAYH